eukprot:CAMPEP_0175772240 /NCGR_PEP_ID=MMETSP0097-20121207/72446_1 /TAXON_ID=311494 /ORGANISM="Alexandrium monilatum, Strain CCMP3105" /LENGTH=34 /DNA_ID= /DNA_START= /DNA_END= /DNA_ORIENTATION=
MLQIFVGGIHVAGVLELQTLHGQGDKLPQVDDVL